jgi:signal transduction histidine kinase
MTLKRALRFLALMIFIFVVVVLLARNSILELRARAEEGFVRDRIKEMTEAVEGKRKVDFVIYRVTKGGGAPWPGEIREVIDNLSSDPGGFRRGEKFWVHVPLDDGIYALSAVPYEKVIHWTKAFEGKETRNVILVMAAFAVFTIVWMWADRRAIAAGQKAKMVDDLERMVRERTEALDRMHRQARLGEFGASLAHEIRNPLGSLVTSARLLSGATESELEDLVGVISRESERLDHILNDFLSFSRDPQPTLRKVSLNLLLEQSLSGLKKSESFSDVRVEYTFDPHLKEVTCDPDQMEQVFWNIALNGAQAMDQGGTLSVSTRRKGPWAEISFKDEGPGINPAKKESIFEPFFTEKKQGTGLGLSIASRIIEAHGGFIQVAGRKGRGAVFTVSIPVNREQ